MLATRAAPDEALPKAPPPESRKKGMSPLFFAPPLEIKRRGGQGVSSHCFCVLTPPSPSTITADFTVHQAPKYSFCQLTWSSSHVLAMAFRRSPGEDDKGINTSMRRGGEKSNESTDRLKGSECVVHTHLSATLGERQTK